MTVTHTHTLLVVILALGAVAQTRWSRAATPVTPNAPPKAQALLDYLSGLPQRQDKRVVSGQFIRWSHNASLDEVASVQKKSGKWVGLIGGDYYVNDKKNAHPLNSKPVNAILIDYARQGGLVTLSVHAGNPQTGGSAWDPKCDLAQVVTDGTPASKRWMEELDRIADGLQELQDAGVVVLFRPFHEMNMNWNWWGNRPPDVYVKLWRQMFDHFTQKRKLTHLLWVFSPDKAPGGAKYYPGDACVDIVGVDAYTADPAKDIATAYTELTKFGKPFGLTEFGPGSGGAPEKSQLRYDLTKLSQAIRERLPLTTFFLFWRDHWGLDQNENVKELLNDPWIVNRGEIHLPR